MKFNHLFFYVLCFLLTSCFSGRNIPLTDNNKLNIKNFNNLNGYYENYAIGFRFKTLWEEILPFTKDALDIDSTATIKVEVKDNSTIEFTLFRKESSVQTRILKYEIINNNLLCKGNWYWKGIPLLFYRQHKAKLIINTDSDNNLVVKANGRYSGGLFIFIFGADINSNLKFKKVLSISKQQTN